MTQEAIANSTVKVTIALSESSLVSVTKAVVVFEGENVANLSLNGQPRLHSSILVLSH